MITKIDVYSDCQKFCHPGDSPLHAYLRHWQPLHATTFPGISSTQPKLWKSLSETFGSASSSLMWTS